MTNADGPIPRVGIGIMIWRDNKVLLVKRKGAHGAGTWSIPGGKLDFGESWEECAAREALEEIGVHLKNIRFLAITNDVFEKDRLHFISIFMEAEWDHSEPTILEPDKIEAIDWRTLTDLPSPLFEPCWTHLRTAKPKLFAPS